MIPSAFAIGSGGINCVDFPYICQSEILKKYFGEGYGLGNFHITYSPSDKYPGYDAWVRSGMGIAPNFFDREILWLNQTFKLPHNVPIVFLDCDTANAFYFPNLNGIAICYELVDDIYRTFSYGDAQEKAKHVGVEDFAETSTLYTVDNILHHELGHALIDIYNLRTAGSEEDLADQFSVYLLVRNPQVDWLGKGFQIITTSTWFKIHSIFEELPHSDFERTHSLSIERFENIRCWGGGGAENAGFQATFLQKNMIPICDKKYTKLKDAWDSNLAPFEKFPTPTQQQHILSSDLEHSSPNYASNVSLKTDQDKYSKGDVIAISASIPLPSVPNAITVTIKNQFGNAVYFSQVETLTPRQFSVTVPVSDQFNKVGEYTITTTWVPVARLPNNAGYEYGEKREAWTTFEIVSASATTSEQQTQQQVQQTQQSKGGGCLIATAAFGSEMAPQVQFLRELRDNTVLQTESGTSFMTGFNQFYYSFSPTIADYERENPVFKEAVKITLTPLLTSLTLLQYADIDSESEMLG